jgi:hypothetical protein
MKAILLVVVVLSILSLFGGCSYSWREPPAVATIDPFYTRGEVDAINAEQNCRNLARSLLQAQRCGVRR